MTEYDDMTPLERAQVDAEMLARDMDLLLKQARERLDDPLHHPFILAQENTFLSVLTSAQVLCSAIAAKRGTNVIPMFLPRRGAAS